MGNIKRIMVGVDLSEHSIDALKYAVELAAEVKAEVIVVNVINQRDVDMITQISLESGHISVPGYIETQERERGLEIDRAISGMKNDGISIRKIFRIGIPFRELLQAISDEGADLMVMGPKGRSNLAEALFGSTAEKCFSKCPIPLLSVRKNR